MKVISKSDLLLLVPIIGDREAFDLDDFELILDRFGDDHFCVDGQMQRVSENKEMKQIREELHKSSKENNVETAEVVHGRWLPAEGSFTYKCSKCNRRVSLFRDLNKIERELKRVYPYCHCGAKMDVEYSKEENND